MKKTKRSLFISIVTLLLCSVMFVGSTFAWFTDTVSNTGNKIQAGTLDVSLWKHDGTEFEDISDSTTPIFDYDKWEPGYSSGALLKIKNDGNLAFKFKAYIKPIGELEVNDEGHTLADAIDVYTKIVTDSSFTMPTSFAVIKEDDTWTKTNLKDIITDADGVAYGVLLPADSEPKYATKEAVGEVPVAIVLHMQEEAGNEYQGMSLGTTFDIQILASQYTYEEDGFGSDQYDLQAEYPIEAEAKYTPGQQTTLVAYGSDNKQNAKAIIPENPDNIPTGTAKIIMEIDDTEKPDAIVLDEGQDSLNVDISFYSVTSDGTKTPITDFGDGKIVPVDLSTVIPDGHELVKVYNTHNPSSPTLFTRATSKDNLADKEFFYDSSTKTMYLASSKFSPFTFVIHEESIASDGMLNFTEITLESKKAYMGTLKPNKDVELIGSGTSESPYQVSSAKELFKALQSTTNATNYIDLTKDIYLGNWYPTYVQKNIVLNGNNHKLYGMRLLTSMGEGNQNWSGATYSGYYAGLIGFAQGGKGFDAEITMSDVTFEDCVACPKGIYANPDTQTKNGWSIAAIIVGKAYGNATFNNVKIDNCVVKTNTKSGLFCGNYTPQNGGQLFKLNNCSINNSNIVSDYNFGYIIGLSTGNNVKGTCSFNNNTLTIGKLLSDWSYVLNASGLKVTTLEETPVYAVFSNSFWALYANCYTYQTSDSSLVPFEEYRSYTSIRVQVNELSPLEN